MSTSHEGRCLCGAVRFRAEGEPKWVIWCHCQSCRRHSGAPASVFVSFDDSKVELIAGEIATYTSPAGTVRGFCAGCGSTLTCTSAALPGETHFHVGAFEKAEALAPQHAVFTEERLPWFPER